MESEYFITARQQNVTLELTEEQYRDLKRARKRLSSTYAISHKYRLVLSNYDMILKAMDDLGHLYMQQEDSEAMESGKGCLNACVNNYILSARIFTSQLKRHVQGCVPQDRELVNTLTQCMESEYHRSFAYRFVDALYDYVSYFGLSVHSLKFESQMKRNDAGEYQRVYTFNAYIEKDFIGGPAEFRVSVFDEIDGRLELISLLKQFNECLKRLHDLAMNLVDGAFTESNALVNEFVNVFVSEHGYEHVNLFVVHRTRAYDRVYDKFPLSMYVNNHNLAKEYL